MSDKPCYAHATHHVLTQGKIYCGAKRKRTTRQQTRQSRKLLLWNKVSALKFCHVVRNSVNKYCFVALSCSASVQAAREPSIFFLYLKHEINMNEPQKDVNIHHFSSLSPPKLIYSPVWFDCRTLWWILCYDCSDCLSIRLPAKGQLHCNLMKMYYSLIYI